MLASKSLPKLYIERHLFMALLYCKTHPGNKNETKRLNIRYHKSENKIK